MVVGLRCVRLHEELFGFLVTLCWLFVAQVLASLIKQYLRDLPDPLVEVEDIVVSAGRKEVVQVCFIFRGCLLQAPFNAHLTTRQADWTS